MSNFIKIRPEGAELLHADRQTDVTNQQSLLGILGKRRKQFINIIIQHYINVAEGGFGTWPGEVTALI